MIIDSLVLGGAIIPGGAQAAAAISLSAPAGPPTMSVTVSGAGFTAGALVDIYFDTTDLCLQFANASGAVSCLIKVPKDAPPQTHWITAVQRNNGAGAQRAFIVRTDWAQFHGRNAAHTGYNPFENTLDRQNVADLDILWRVSIGPAGTTSTPVVAGGNVYIGALDGKLHAFSAQTGVAVPGFPKTLGGEVRHSSPAVGHGNVYVATAGAYAKLYAIKAATGAPIAGFPIALGLPVYSSPVLYGGNVYVASTDGKIYAFNAVTGAALPGFPIVVEPGVYDTTIYATPSIVGDRIYVGRAKGGFYAFDATTGARIAPFPIGPASEFIASAAIASGQLFLVASEADRLWAVGANGTWSEFLAPGTDLHGSSPAVGAGRLIFGSRNGIVHSYSLGDGAPQWNAQLTHKVDSSPIIANSVVYVNSMVPAGSVGGMLYALDAATGARLWRAPVPASELASPAVADGIVFIGSTDGHLYAFSLDGVAPSARLKGGARGIRPTLSSLKPDRTLRPTRN
jgi:outer membrane protein assembly factor BamB